MTVVNPRAYRRWAYATAIRLLVDTRRLTAAGGPDVDDVAQEGMIAIWIAAGKHDPSKGALPPWVTHAALTRMREIVYRDRPALGEGDRTRPHGSRHTRPPESLDALQETLTVDGPDPEALERQLAVREAVGALPDRERVVVTVVDLLDGSATDAAPLAGVSTGHVRNIRRRAHGRLRESLAGLAA